jgi:hypothetical protein
VAPPRQRPESELQGLQGAAYGAPSPVMKEIARIALIKGLTCGEIAREYNRRHRTKALLARNVSRHFDSEKPRPETLNFYAKLLGISDVYLRLLESCELPNRVTAEANARAYRELLLRMGEFTSGTREAFEQAFERLEETSRSRLAAAFRLAEYRDRFELLDDRAARHPEFVSRFGQPLAAFAHELLPDMNLFKRVRKNVDHRLFQVWYDLGFLFAGDSAAEADHVIAFTVGLLRARGVDTTRMEATLREMQRAFLDGLQIPVATMDSIDRHDIEHFAKAEETQK